MYTFFIKKDKIRPRFFLPMRKRTWSPPGSRGVLYNNPHPSDHIFRSSYLTVQANDVFSHARPNRWSAGTKCWISENLKMWFGQNPVPIAESAELRYRSTRSGICCACYHRRSIPLPDTNLWYTLSIFRNFETLPKHPTTSSLSFENFQPQKAKTQKVVNNRNFWKTQSFSGRQEASGCSEKISNFLKVGRIGWTFALPKGF